MGTSTDAILFYGILLDDDECEGGHPWNTDDPDADDDWEGFYLQKVALDLKYPEPKDWVDRTLEEQDAIDKFYDEKRAVLGKLEVEVNSHCYIDYPMHYLALKACHTRASRGESAEIKSLAVPSDADAKIKEFCEIMGLEYQQPRWWLVSYWG